MLLLWDHPSTACTHDKERAIVPLLKTTPLSICSGQKMKEALKATTAADIDADSRLYVQLGQFAALLVDICAWRMAEYMSLTGGKEGRQVPVLQWKTPADTILVPVASVALILVSESSVRREEWHLHSQTDYRSRWRHTEPSSRNKRNETDRGEISKTSTDLHRFHLLLKYLY